MSMSMRRIIFATEQANGSFVPVYDTGTEAHQWTLSEYKVGAPAQQTNYLTVPGRPDGPVDLSTALSDGIPLYGSRQLSARLEASDGTRAQRLARITELLNTLDGYTFSIFGPDDSGMGTGTAFLRGRVSCSVDYSDAAHAAVTVKAVCEPWLYNRTLKGFTAVGSLTIGGISGRRAAEPLVWMQRAGRLVSDNGEMWRIGADEPVQPSGLILVPGMSLTLRTQEYTAAGWVDADIAFSVSYREGWL